MKSVTLPLLTVLLHTLATHASPLSLPSCTNYTIPLSITTSNLAFGLPRFTTNFDVADFIDSISSRNTSTAASVVAPTRHNVSATYSISATFCQPREVKKRTVLVATHGLNFDKNYWDPEVDKERYSFVDWAVKEGYSVLFYDRLGVGLSERVSGYVPQLANQVAILGELVKGVREGRYTGTVGKPGKVVLVGHSFGSAVSLNAVAERPELVDGVVLTGFSLNGTANNLLGFVEGVAPRIAREQDGERWGGLDSVSCVPRDYEGDC